MSLSIRQRILLVPLMPILLLSYPLLIHFPSQFAEAARLGVEGKVNSLGNLVGNDIAADLALLASGMGEAADVQGRLKGLAEDADIVSVHVYAADRTFVTGLKTGEGVPLAGGEISLGIESLKDRLIYTGEIQGEEGRVGWLKIEASLVGVEAQASSQRFIAGGIGAVILLVSLALAVFLGSQISSRIVRATEIAGRVAQGDLTVEVPSQRNGDELGVMFKGLAHMVDELRALATQVKSVAQCDLSVDPSGHGDLSEAFGEMVSRQRELVQELSATSSALESSTRQILATLRQQEAGSHDQASAVEEARRTMDSLLAAANKITDAARMVHENAQRTRASSESTAERASQLNQLTGRIGDVLMSITKIADKSDILALNAALEGTKAGEAGKGFILVAEEMRRLAESVVLSVRDISELVETIREASHASVLATEQGVKLSLETTKSAEMIRLTSQQQQSGTEQATHSMNEMSELIQQSVSGASQSTQAVEELNHRANRLQQLLAIYNLGGAQSGNGRGAETP